MFVCCVVLFCFNFLDSPNANLKTSPFSSKMCHDLRSSNLEKEVHFLFILPLSPTHRMSSSFYSSIGFIQNWLESQHTQFFLIRLKNVLK